MRPLFTGPLTVNRVTVPIFDLPQRLEGCRIVQLSDFHYDGLRLSTELLRQVVDRVNGLRPDLIALTGDYVTTDPTPIWELTSYLSQMQSRYGTVAILGNHDNITLDGRQMILRSLRQAGVECGGIVADEADVVHGSDRNDKCRQRVVPLAGG